MYIGSEVSSNKVFTMDIKHISPWRLLFFLSVLSTKNATSSNQTLLVYVWDKRYIYMYTLVHVTKFVYRICICCYISQYNLAHIRLQRYSSQKSIYFLLSPFCIKFATIHLNACKFAIMYLYREVKFKPTEHEISTVNEKAE